LDSRARTETAALPLSGIRVVAIEHAVAAPLCSRHLADLGAEVIKIERPGGDFARRYNSVVLGQSAHFIWLNRGKRSVVLDLKEAGDRTILDALLERADVLVHNLGPGAIERLGLGWEALHARWPRLISCSISGYGVDGPYRDRKAYDLLLQGESAVMAVTGTEQQSAQVGIPVADIGGGMYALAAILAALHERERTGEGRFIDISMLECLAEWMAMPVYHQIYEGRPPPRSGMRHATIVPYGPFRAADGAWVNVAVQNEGQWERLCGLVLRQPELATDARFRTNEERLRHRTELEPIVEAAFAGLGSGELIRLLEAADVPYGSVNSVGELVAHPQLRARERWLDTETPAGLVRALTHPFNIRGMPRRPAAVPAIDEHGEEVRRESAPSPQRAT
jgi:itaconate CoA-transferase